MKILKKNTPVLLLLLFAFNVNCQILQVPTDYATIQSAIKEAQEGDTVLVDEGRYYENINFRGKNIVVASKYILDRDTSFISNTIIDGSKPIYPDSASCVMFYEPGDSLAVLEGFTLTGGTGSTLWLDEFNTSVKEGGGIILVNSKATIKHNIIDSNSIATDGGGGISSFYGKPSILNNIIMNNTAGYAAGLVLNWSDGIIKNNIIYHNKKTGSNWLTGGLMVWNSPGQPIIENNTIVGNISSTYAGGISITSRSNPIVRNNIVWVNRQSYGLQFYEAGSRPDIVKYCNSEHPVVGEGNISSFPVLAPHTFALATGSPCIDSGSDSSLYNDIENTLESGKALSPSLGSVRNDMGAFGGPGATLLNSFHVEDIYSVSAIGLGEQYIGDSLSKKFEVLNLGTSTLNIDSITLRNNDLTIEFGEELKALNCLKNDTVTIKWKPATAGEFTDTLKIFHSFKSIKNPKEVIVSGEAKAAQEPLNTKIKPGVKMLSVLPNPCTENCQIKYTVERNSFINISVFDLGGTKVRDLVNQHAGAGEYTYEFNRNDLAGGVYFVRFTSNGNTSTSRFILK